MEQGLIHWDPTENHQGVFGDYTIIGVKLQNPAGDVGWHITSKSERDSAHDFWVVGRNFHRMSIDFFHKGGNNLLQVYVPPITSEIEQAERGAMLKAIDEWEKPSTAA
jgi:hypothetical protein